MPRPPRYIFANECYHVLNRANNGNVFHAQGDYAAFADVMAKAQDRLHLPLLAVCLMPNHFHLVVKPRGDDDLARWLQWLCTTHVRHHHRKFDSHGRLGEGRYKAFLVQDDHYLLTVMRYVERNALRKGLVTRAEDWRWSSLAWRSHAKPPLALEPSPLELPANWADFVNLPQTSAELEAIRTSVTRQRPFGDPMWVEAKANEAGLGQSLVSVGRPRRQRPDPVC
jgi:putative transposase